MVNTHSIDLEPSNKSWEMMTASLTLACALFNNTSDLYYREIKTLYLGSSFYSVASAFYWKMETVKGKVLERNKDCFSQNGPGNADGKPMAL